jgi:hypothetical protein
MEVSVNGSRGNGGLWQWHCRQRKQLWDGGMMTLWHPRQWRLWPMVVVAMAVVVVNCAAAVDASATILSLLLMVAAKTQPLPPPLTTASVKDDYNCCRQQLPLLLPYSRRSIAAVVFVDGNSNGEGSLGGGQRGAQGQGASEVQSKMIFMGHQISS